MSSDLDKLKELCEKKYKDQAIWFLNAFWYKFAEKEAEKIWAYKHRFAELDQQRHADGCQLDELFAHRFLESFNETMTVLQMRNGLRDVGIPDPKPYMVPISYFLIFRFRADWHELVNAPQGDNVEEIARAEEMLEAAKNALNEAQLREEESIVAKRELEVALAELKAQEDAYNARTAELKRKSEEGSVVQKNKAKNELAQHLAGDSLPLRRAKINQEAAVRKAERAMNAAIAAREEADRRVAEAEAYLEELKKKGGSGQGTLWWLERELHEAKKYKPTSKGGISKK